MEPLQAFLDTTTLEQADTFEVECMIQRLLSLTVDLSKIKPACGAHVAVSSFKHQLRKSSDDGELMSAKRFIAVCCRFGLGERKGHEDTAACLKHMAKCMEIMMHHFQRRMDRLLLRHCVKPPDDLVAFSILEEHKPAQEMKPIAFAYDEMANKIECV